MSTELYFLSQPSSALEHIPSTIPAVMDAVSIVQKLQQARKDWRPGFDSWVRPAWWEMRERWVLASKDETMSSTGSVAPRCVWDVLFS